MNGIVCGTAETGIIDRHSAVDVTNGAGETKWNNETDRLSTYPTTGDRSALLRSHAAKSAECGQHSPRARRVPRESRRVSLAQASGYVQLNQYRLLEPIGQGSYGIVKLAYNEEDDTHYAMKILSKRKLMRRAGLFGRAPPRRPGPGPPPDPLQRVYREIAVLKKLDHPNVVKLVEVLDDPAEDQLYLVFQLLEGGPVIEIPTENPLSEDLAQKYFRDALLGVEYLHYQRIAHRDIKPANLLLGEDRVQVADLGACGELAGRLSGAVGTPAFRAPEAAAPTDNYCGEAADIWSLGITLYAMVTGRVPWTGSNSVELQRRVLTEPLSFPPRHQPSRLLRHLLTRMLDKDPGKRADMKEIKEHPWITSEGADPLPSEQENCRLVEVTDEDMARVVTSIPNLSTLILIKTMLKKHSFQNPFLRSREGSSSRRDSECAPPAPAPRALPRPGLARAGRSLSAPGNYLTERQASFDIALESVHESRDQSREACSKDVPDESETTAGSIDVCQSTDDSKTDSCQSGKSSTEQVSSRSSVEQKSTESDQDRNSDLKGNVNSDVKNSNAVQTKSVVPQNSTSSNRSLTSRSQTISDKTSYSQNPFAKCENFARTSKNVTSTQTTSSKKDYSHTVSGKSDQTQTGSGKSDKCQPITNKTDSCHSVRSKSDSCQSGSGKNDSCQSGSDKNDSCQSGPKTLQEKR